MKRRILLVEDDADYREVFAHALRQALAPERLDVAFVEAGSLAEARARLREGGLDAALIDVTMPDGNGLELVGEINDGGAGNSHPDYGADGEPRHFRSRSGYGVGREGGALQAGCDYGDRRSDKEADRRRTLRGMSPLPDGWDSISNFPLLTRQPGENREDKANLAEVR